MLDNRNPISINAISVLVSEVDFFFVGEKERDGTGGVGVEEEDGWTFARIRLQLDQHVSDEHPGYERTRIHTHTHTPV